MLLEMARAGARKGKMTRKSATPQRPSKTETFPQALAKLLKSRGLDVPSALVKAPPAAYAGQPASFVKNLERLEDPELAAQAARIANYTSRQEKRARSAWETHPLIAEIRKRKIREPKRPTRFVGVAINFRKPLEEWTDEELLEAASEWSRSGRE